MSAIEQADRRFPRDNAAFLDAVINEVYDVTGAIYGVGTYQRLLRDAGPVLGVTRRPSNTTIQKAVDRAQVSARLPASHEHDEETGAGALDLGTLRRALEPMMRDVIASIPALLSDWLKDQSSVFHTDAAASSEQTFALELAQASLDDARRRARALEDDAARLRRELGAAETRAALAETRITSLLEDVHRAIRGSAVGAEALALAAQRLEGTERFIKQQYDAVRQQATAEVEGLRRRNQQLSDQVSQLQIQNDHYRRLVAVQRGVGTAP